MLDEPDLGDADWSILAESYERLAGSDLWFADLNGADIHRVCAIARYGVAHYGIQLIVVDHLQRIRGQGTEYDYTSEAICSLKDLAKETNTVLIVPTQFNRDKEAKSSLDRGRGSGRIGEECDDYLEIRHQAKQEGEYPKRADIIVEKHRTGAKGVVPVWWYPNLTCFREIAREEADG
jgi:replicative DNA helicase